MGNVLPAGAEDESASRKNVKAAFSLGRYPRWSGPASSPWRNSCRAGTRIGGRRGETLAEGTFVGLVTLAGGGISPETEALVGGNPSPAAAPFPGLAPEGESP